MDRLAITARAGWAALATQVPIWICGCARTAHPLTFLPLNGVWEQLWDAAAYLAPAPAAERTASGRWPDEAFANGSAQLAYRDLCAHADMAFEAMDDTWKQPFRIATEASRCRPFRPVGGASAEANGRAVCARFFYLNSSRGIRSTLA